MLVRYFSGIRKSVLAEGIEEGTKILAKILFDSSDYGKKLVLTKVSDNEGYAFDNPNYECTSYYYNVLRVCYSYMTNERRLLCLKKNILNFPRGS